MNRLELLIPPPVTMLVTGILMWGSSALFPWLGFTWLYSTAWGGATALLGLAVSLSGVVTFKRARTTVDPRRPGEATTLITSGIYRYSRNPMYLGVMLILVGWALFLGNLLSALLIVGFVVYINRYQILPEERLLQEKFGADFVAYKEKVRRWI